MKKTILTIFCILLILGMVTGCLNSTKTESKISFATSRNTDQGYVHFSREGLMFDMKIGDDSSDFYKFKYQNGVRFSYPEEDIYVSVGLVDINDPYNVNNVKIAENEKLENVPNKLKEHINVLMHGSIVSSLVTNLTKNYHSNITDMDLIDIKYNKTEKIGNYNVALFEINETNHLTTANQMENNNGLHGYLLKLNQGNYIYFISENEETVHEWIESIIEIDASIYNEELKTEKVTMNNGYYGANIYELELSYEYTSFKDLIASSYNVRFTLPFNIASPQGVGHFSKYSLFISKASYSKTQSDFIALNLDEKFEDSKSSYEHNIIDKVSFPDKLYTFTTNFNYISSKHVNVNGYDVIETTYEIVDKSDENIKYYGVDCFYDLKGNYNDYNGIKTLHISAIDYSSTGENINELTKMLENIIKTSEEDVVYEKLH